MGGIVSTSCRTKKQIAASREGVRYRRGLYLYEALDAMQPSLVDLSLTPDAIACNDDDGHSALDGHSGLLFDTHNAAVRQWVHS